MCGIIGVTGSDEALDIILDGLARLEYRGYDSAGLVVQTPAGLWRGRAANDTRSLEDLRKQTQAISGDVRAGIGHTRWATHGRPDEANAHPHVDCRNAVAVVHNGIFENAVAIRRRLAEAGHVFTSETDTEVLAHLIEEQLAAGQFEAVEAGVYSSGPPDTSRGSGLDRVEAESRLVDAVRASLAQVVGAFAISVVWEKAPELIVAARRLSPLVVGLGDTHGSDTDPELPEGLVASDIPALLGRTRRFWILEDDQVAEVRPGSIRVTGLDGLEVEPKLLEVDWSIEHAQKGGFDDFMSKEIQEQPQAVADTLRGRLQLAGSSVLDEVRISDEELRAVDKLCIVACGSSYHAGLVAKYAIEHWARLPVEVDISSEFRYRDPVLDGRTLVIGISQSGETIDSLHAMRQARALGAKVLVLSNVVGSNMAREADGVLYTRAGPEVGVAATKTHLTQLAALEVLALHLAFLRGSMDRSTVSKLMDGLGSMPDLIADTVARADQVREVVERRHEAHDVFFLGRHVGFPVALEGALKLKEIAYLRAEAYPAGELKHGPIALIEPGTLVVGVATRTALWDKMMSNVAEVRSRGAEVVLVANDGDHETADLADDVLWVPKAPDPLFAPLVDVVPLQQLAYFFARHRGYNVDRPRNLAKTVTVE